MRIFTQYIKRIAVPVLLLLAGSASAQNILNEGFESSTFPPTGWTTAIQNNTSYAWTIGNSSSGHAGPPHSGSQTAYYNDYNANGGLATLTTPAFSLQSYSGGYGQLSFWYYSNTVDAGVADNLEIYVSTSNTYVASGPGQVLLATLTLGATNGWNQYTYTIPPAYNTGSAYIIFRAVSAYGNWSTTLDDVSIDYILPCVAPSAAPTNIAFSTTPGSSTINGTITPAPSSSSTLVVRTAGTTPVGATPVNGTSYTVGSTFGAGTIVSTGTATVFADAGLPASTQYTYTAFSYNSVCSGGPTYRTTPLVLTTTSGGPINLPYIQNFDAMPAYASSTTSSPAIIPPLYTATLTTVNGTNPVWNLLNTSASSPTTSPNSPPGMMSFDSYSSGCYHCSSAQVDLASPLLNFGGSPTTPVTIQVTFWMTQDNNSTYVAPFYGDEGIATYISPTVVGSGGSLLGFSSRSNINLTNSNGNWVKVTYVTTTTLATGYIILQGRSQDGNNFFMDDLSIIKLAPCTTPTAAPASITLNTSTVGVISGTITPAASSDAVLVVRTTGNQPVNAIPQNGVNYTVGQTFGAGIVVYSNTNNVNTFTDNVGSATLYTYTAFSYNGQCINGPNYYTSAYTTTATSAFNPFSTVQVTGYNVDAIANGSTAPNAGGCNFSATGVNGLDNGNPSYAYFSQDYSYNGAVTSSSTGYLPNNGLINSAITPGLSWQLQNYSGLNCLQLSSATPQTAVAAPGPVTTGTLTFVTPQRSPIIYLLQAGLSAPSGGVKFTATVNFTDGSSQSFTNQTANDWFGSSYAYAGAGRINYSTGGIATSGLIAGVSGQPGLYQSTLTLSGANTLKLISSITFTNTTTGSTNGTLAIFGISIVSPCNGTPTASTISSAALSSNICAGSTATINVNEAPANSTVSGIAYVWQQAPTATGPWTPVVGGSGNGTTSYTTNGLASTTYFRMLDSCIVTGQTMPTTNVYQVPVNSYGIPYTQNFTAFANGNNTSDCISSNVNGSSKWAEFDNFKSADGTTVPKAFAANDPTNNGTGKNEYFTIPAMLLQGGIQYRVKFGYARGRDGLANATPTNTGTAYNENLNLYVSSPIAPGTAGSQPPPNGLSIFNTTINFDNFASANVLYTAPTTSTYYFSWYTNTPHPQAGSGVPGGYVAVDSIKIDSVGCVAPTITFNPLSTVACIGNNATFTVNATAYGIGYQWQVSTNGGTTWANISDGVVPGATPSVYAGSLTGSLTIQAASSAMNSYKFRCYITGTCGGSPTPATSNAATLTVSTFPTASITAGGATAICPGTTVALNANTGTGLSYQWKLNGISLVNSNAATYAAGSAGGYTVTVTNANGCSATSTPTIVTLNQAPAITISASGPTTFCSGNSLTLTANTGVNITYQWLQNNSNYGLPINTLTVNSSGSYSLKETNTANGCSATYPAPINVIVNGPATATATAAGPTSFCLGGSVTLNANTGTGYTYQWQVSTNGGAPVNITGTGGNSPVYSAANTGAYRVVITQNGCSLTSNYDTVTVNSPSAVVTASSPSICGGNSSTLSAVSNPNYTYQWYNGTTAISPGGNGSTYTTNVPGSYTVALHDVVSGCNSTSNPIVLNTSTPPPAFITAASATTFCSGNGNSVLLYADTAITASTYNYQWRVDSGYGYVTIPGANTYKITTGASGNYQVIVSNGCTTTSSPTSVVAVPAPAPVITTSGSTSLCPNAFVTMTTGTGSGLTYQWSNTSGNISGATTQSYTTGNTNASSGSETFTVKVTNNNGCSGTASKTVTYYTYPVAHISVSRSTKLCQGDDIILSADGVVPGNNYKWTNNGNIIASGPSIHTATAGTYNVRVTNAGGCTATSQDTVITVIPLPVATVTPSGTTYVCSGNNVTLTANSGDGLTYQWTYAGGGIGSGTNSTYSANIAGTYAVMVTDTNNCHNISSNTVVVYNPTPSASIVSPAADTAVCQGNTATLTAATGSSYTYQWKLNGNNITGATAASYTTSQSGTYTVTVYQGACSSASSNRVVTVNPLPASDTIGYIGLVAPAICDGASAALMAPSGSGYSYQWMLNGANITGATSANYAATVAGDYSVKVTTGAGCSETTLSLMVNSYPDPNPSIIAYNSTLTTGTFVTYQWYFNGVAIPNATTNSIVAQQNGNYTVYVTDANGCSKMSAAYNMQDATGVPGVISKLNVKVYPNPATSTIRIDAPVIVNVSISSLDGRVLIHKDKVTEVNIDGLANGAYMITITDEQNAVIKIDKLVKSGL